MEVTYQSGQKTPRETMPKELNDAKEFYLDIKACLVAWGGKELEKQASNIFDVFCLRDKISRQQIAIDIQKIIFSNYRSAGGISVDDIVKFLLRRYLEYLKK